MNTAEDIFEIAMADGTIHRKRGTRWRNPTGQPVKLELSYDGPRFVDAGTGRPLALVQKPCWLSTDDAGHLVIAEVSGHLDVAPHVVVPPHGEVVLPADFDMAVQHTHCHEPQCIRQPFACRETSHRRTVVGGQGPQLTRADGTHPAPVHPALDPAAPPRVHAQVLADPGQDERLLARVRGGAR